MKVIIGKPRIRFEPRDIWIGVYWKFSRWSREPQSDLYIYVCFVPMLPLIFHLHFINLEWYQNAEGVARYQRKMK